MTRLTLTVKEAAAIMGVAPLTLRRRIETGEIPAVRIGDRVLVPAPALAELLGCSTRELLMLRDA